MSVPARAVLLNPHAQGGRAAHWGDRLRAVLPAGVALHTPDTVADAHARIAALPRGSRVVAVGGDGTLHRWLPALLDGGHSLGVVALGSGNDVARALGAYGQPPTAALAHALAGDDHPIDVGEAVWHDRAGHIHRVAFLSSVSAGFDAAVVRRSLRAPRGLRGLPRYLWATLGEVAWLRRWRVEITADDALAHRGEVLFAATLNTSTFGSGMPAVPGARVHDGVLNLLVAGRFGRFGTLTMLPRLLLGAHLGHPRVHTRPYETLDLTAETDLPLAADGEWLGEARTLRVCVHPGALRAVRRPAG